MAFLALETRMPYRADFVPADIGKLVFFAFRWIGKNNHPGPWSPVVSHVIPRLSGHQRGARAARP